MWDHKIGQTRITSFEFSNSTKYNYMPFDAAEFTHLRNPLNEPTTGNPGSGVDHPPTSSAEIKERVELYLYSPSGTSWPVIGWTLPLPLPQTIKREELPGSHRGFSEELWCFESEALCKGKLILEVWKDCTSFERSENARLDCYILKMKEVWSFETPRCNCPTTQMHIPEDVNFHTAVTERFEAVAAVNGTKYVILSWRSA